MKKICPTCKKVFYKKPSDSKKYWKIKKYCSIKCSGTLFRKGQVSKNKGKIGRCGKDSNSWKGGRNIAKNGYVRVLIIGKGKYQLEHRAIMESILGRKLDKKEIVHHKNGIRNDNRIENLMIMNKKDHDKYETTRRWKENPSSFGRK